MKGTEREIEKMKEKRSVLIAGFLNFFSPGLGFLYIGKPAYAVGIPVILLLLIALLPSVTVIFYVRGFLAVAALTGILVIGSTIWVCSIAYKQVDISLKRYQKWYVYLTFVIALILAGNGIQVIRSNLFGVELYRIPSSSMMPTLLIGDFIIANTSFYKSSVKHEGDDNGVKESPGRGDVIVFNYPDDPDTLFVKRVVGIPGDKIGYFGKRLYINDTPVEVTDLGDYSGVGKGSFMTGARLYKEYLTGINYNILVTSNSNSAEGKIVVPDDQYFVIGDNRDHSNDSRYRGFVPKDNITGKVVSIWMNWDPEGGIDSSRIGNSVQ